MPNRSATDSDGASATASAIELVRPAMTLQFVLQPARRVPGLSGIRLPRLTPPADAATAQVAGDLQLATSSLRAGMFRRASIMVGTAPNCATAAR